MAAISPAFAVIAVVLLGLIPAAIAHGKGYSFTGWWLYGTLLFPLALPHAVLAGDRPRIVPHLDQGEPLARRRTGTIVASRAAKEPRLGGEADSPRARREEREASPFRVVPGEPFALERNAPEGDIPNRYVSERDVPCRFRAVAEGGVLPHEQSIRSRQIEPGAAANTEAPDTNPEDSEMPFRGDASSPRPSLQDSPIPAAPSVDPPWSDADFARIAEGGIRRDFRSRSFRTSAGFGLGAAVPLRKMRGRGLGLPWLTVAACIVAIGLAGYFGASDRWSAAFARHAAIADGIARAVSNVQIAATTLASSVRDAEARGSRAPIDSGGRAERVADTAPAEETNASVDADLAPLRDQDANTTDQPVRPRIRPQVDSPIRAGVGALGSPSRQTVARVQASLRSLGYDIGPPDGILGPRTRAAIRAYQRRADLPATGIIDRRLMISLNMSTRPRRG